jgi:hypothetical protein
MRDAARRDTTAKAFCSVHVSVTEQALTRLLAQVESLFTRQTVDEYMALWHVLVDRDLMH